MNAIVDICIFPCTIETTCMFFQSHRNVWEWNTCNGIILLRSTNHFVLPRHGSIQTVYLKSGQKHCRELMSGVLCRSSHYNGNSH